MCADGFDGLRERCEALFPRTKYRSAGHEGEDKKEPFFSKLPDHLSRSVEVSAEAIVLFGVLHSLSSEKCLARRPIVQVSLKELCWLRHKGETKIREYLKELQVTGWIDILHRGVKKVNRYRLYESSAADRQGAERLESIRRKLREPEVVKRLSKRSV